MPSGVSYNICGFERQVLAAAVETPGFPNRAMIPSCNTLAKAWMPHRHGEPIAALPSR